jgi:hypothetical protein
VISDNTGPDHLSAWRTVYDRTVIAEARAELAQVADDLAQMQAGWDAADAVLDALPHVRRPDL